MVWQFGNLTSQAGSNLYLANFDNYVVEELKLKNYIRYVDDIVIVSNSKEKLTDALPKIMEKLAETYQFVCAKKAKIDTIYHGTPFLGKVTYPYNGYQKASKQVDIRVMQNARRISYSDIDNLIAKTNSEVGFLKNYNCRKLIFQYGREVLKRTDSVIKFNKSDLKFQKQSSNLRAQ